MPDLPANSVTVVLDERGEALGSTELAAKLEGWRDGGKREARFLIGAADGHDDEVRAVAPTCCCRSARRPGRICWSGRCSPSNCSAPTSILANHPYHREGLGDARRASSLLLAARRWSRRRRAAAAGAARRSRQARGRAAAAAGRGQAAAGDRRPAPERRLERLRAEQRAAAAARSRPPRRGSPLAELRLAPGSARLSRHSAARWPRRSGRSPSLLAGLAMMARAAAAAGAGRRGEHRRAGRDPRCCSIRPCPVIRRRTAALCRRSWQRGRAARAPARTAQARARRRAAPRSPSGAAALRRARAARCSSDRRAPAAQALGAGDDVARRRRSDRARCAATSRGSARDRALAADACCRGRASRRGPARPTAPRSAPPFAYRLPADAPVTQGLGAVDRSGVRVARPDARHRARRRARRPRRRAWSASPARSAAIDGVVIIDHGGGWMSLLVNVASPLRRGQRVAAGDPLGRALGPIAVELSRNGQRLLARSHRRFISTAVKRPQRRLNRRADRVQDA